MFSLLAQTSSPEAAESAVKAMTLVYTIVLSLSIGEAFKQFVNDDTSSGKEQPQWDRLRALVAFLLLAFPFAHGMNRYVFDVYLTSKRMEQYASYLIFDVLVFTIEAGLFFAMSRTLRRVQWRQFYMTVSILLVLDVLWGSLVWKLHPRPEISGWVIANLITLIPLALILWRGPKIERTGPCLCLSLIVIRVVCDYGLAWSFYFP